MKPYPNAMNYDSDVDYYLACKNYSQATIQAEYDNRKKEAISKLYDVSAIAEMFDFAYDITDELNEHIEEIERILTEAEPTKVLDY